MSGTPLAEAFVRVRADGTQLKPDIDKALDVVDGKSAGSRVGGGFTSSFGGAIKGIAGMLGGIFAVTEIAKFAGDSVQAFSDVEDASAAASVVFGSSMGKIESQAAGAATAMGMSRAQVIDAANTFGTFGKSAGLTGDSLANFSTQMTATAGDMASFKGGTPEDAIQAVGAALRGETEPIRRYGVLLDDASMRAQAMKMGLISTTKDALTPQQKVLAAQALILKQTSDAQGDFARTSDSTANTQKTLNAVWENTQATVGQQLAPAFTFVRGILIQLLGTFTSALPGMISGLSGLQSTLAPLGDGLSAVFGFLFGGSYTMGSVPWIDPYIMALGELTGLTEEVQNAVGLFVGTIMGTGSEGGDSIRPEWINPIIDAGAQVATTLDTIKLTLSMFIGAVGAGFNSMVAQIVPPFTALVATIQERIAVMMPIVMQIVNFLLAKFQEIIPVIQPIMTNIGAIIGLAMSIIGSLIKQGTDFALGFWRAWGSTILSVASAVIDTVVGVVRGFSDILAGIFKVIASVLKGDWGGAWDGIKQIVDGAVRIVGSVVDGLARTLGAVFEGIKTNLANLMKAAWDGIKGAVDSGIKGMMGFVTGIPGQIEGALRGLADIGSRAGKALIDSLTGGIRDAASGAYNAAQDALNAIARLFPHSPAEEGPFSGSGYTDHSGRALIGDFGAAIEDSGSDVLDPAAAIMSELSAMFNVEASASMPVAGLGLGGASRAIGVSGSIDRSDRMEALLQQLIAEVRAGHVIELDGDVIGRANTRDARSYGLAGV